MIAKFFITLAFVLGAASPLPAFAAIDPYGGINCGRAGDSAVCQTKGNSADPIAGPNGVLIKATNVIAFVAGAAAIFFIIFAGIKYITAQGDPSQISNAKTAIIYAFAGLVIIVLARQIISFVLSKV
jgi:hypothetical protein